MMSYTDPQRIADYLGLTFTGDQEARSLQVANAAASLIDADLGRSWPGSGEIEAERQTVYGDRIYLAHVPVTDLTAIVIDARSITGTDTTLVDGTDYRLRDAALGEVQVAGGYHDRVARVDYEHEEEVPDDVAEFATALAAGMMAVSLPPGTLQTTIRELAVAGGASIRYADSSGSGAGSTAGAMQDSLAALRRRYRRPIVV